MKTLFSGLGKIILLQNFSFAKWSLIVFNRLCGSNAERQIWMDMRTSTKSHENAVLGQDERALITCRLSHVSLRMSWERDEIWYYCPLVISVSCVFNADSAGSRVVLQAQRSNSNVKVKAAGAWEEVKYSYFSHISSIILSKTTLKTLTQCQTDQKFAGSVVAHMVLGLLWWVCESLIWSLIQLHANWEWSVATQAHVQLS